MTTPSGYAHPELLVESQWLAEHLEDPDVRIVDCDLIAAYRRAHIPGAVGIVSAMAAGDNYWKDPQDRVHVMPPELFAEEMAKMGIGDGTLVVAYDASRSLSAARFWWVLNLYGHDRVVVLDGGWHAWLAEGLSITTVEPRYPRATFTLKPRNAGFYAGADDVLQAIGKPGAVILDVRSDGEYTGATPRPNTRGGHIPGAVHKEWLNAIDDDDLQKFKPAAELREMFEAQGVTPEKEVIAH